MQLAEAWEPPPRELGLENNEIHLWLITVPTELDSLPGYRLSLTEEERTRADRFHFPEDRARFTLGRGVLRKLLMRYSAATEIALGENEYGKLHLTQPAGSLQFNVAHSGDLVLLGFSRGRALGVDVEKFRPDFATTDVAERFFAPDEATVLAALPQPERVAGFFSCWTRKEAYIKARGMGLSLPLHSFSVAFGSREVPALLRVEGDPSAPQRWTIMDLPTAEGYAAATAFEGRDCAVTQWRWGTNPS
jgi:4'-phosphopantetheinyl transferase